MHRLTRPAIILACEDFVPFGWNNNDSAFAKDENGERLGYDQHCCGGCHYEDDEGLYALERHFPKARDNRWSRVELHVCCSLKRWLDAQEVLGEKIITGVLINGRRMRAANVRNGKEREASHLFGRERIPHRTVDRDFVAKVVRRARKEGKRHA